MIQIFNFPMSSWCSWLSHLSNTQKVLSSILSEDTLPQKPNFFFFC